MDSNVFSPQSYTPHPHKALKYWSETKANPKLVSELASKKSSQSLRKLAYGSVYRPGIDLALIIALVSSGLDVLSMFLPWLAGINSEYLPGRGLTYTVAVVLSGIDLLDTSPYLIILVFPLIFTVILTVISIKGEGIKQPLVGYKTKSRILLLLGVVCSMIPAYAFMNTAMMGIYNPRPGAFVGRWELGGATTMPIYSGLGFVLALGLRIIKD